MGKAKENKLVVGSWSWAETIPDWLLNQVKAERMVSGLIGIMQSKLQEVGDAELLIYLMTASLRAPLPYNYTEVYLYLVTQVSKRREIEVPNDIRKDDLTPNEERTLNELRQRIYRSRGNEVQHPIFEVLKELKKEAGRMSCEKTLFD